MNGQRLVDGDGARLRNVRELRFSDGENAEVLVFALRPVEVPGFLNGQPSPAG